MHVVHDITERKQMIDELRAWGVRMHSILDRAPFGVFIASADMKIEFANPAVLEISGYTRKQFVGACLGDLPGCIELGMKPLILGALRGVPFRIGPAPFHCHHEGRTIHGRFTGIPVEEGGRRRRSSFVEDLSDLTAANEERHRLTALLLQAQKMEAIGTLASGDRARLQQHPPRGHRPHATPAPSSSPAGHPALEHLASVVAAAERGSELVRQLLAFSRQQELNAQRLDVAAARRGHAPHARPRSSRATSPSRCGRRDGLPAVVADPVQIGQVLMNLAINARDAMPGGGTLCLSRPAAATRGGGRRRAPRRRPRQVRGDHGPATPAPA